MASTPLCHDYAKFPLSILYALLRYVSDGIAFGGWVNLKDIKHKLGNLPIKLGLPIGNLPIKLGLPNCLKTCNMFWKHDGHDT